jgi:hypothetical protein
MYAGVFDNCNGLNTVYCKPTTPPSGAENIFQTVPNLTTIYVPIGQLERYKSDPSWGVYADKMVAYNFDGLGGFEGEQGTFN